MPRSTILTNDQELHSLLTRNDFASNGLIKAIVSFLFSAAHLVSIGDFKVCNFVVHPSVKTGHHNQIKVRVNDYLKNLSKTFETSDTESIFRKVHDDLGSTKPELIDYPTAVAMIKDFLDKGHVQIKVMNSTTKSQDYSEGINILIGGNSLGRGITFPKLQTMYYCRTAQTPQADTIWQHCRMFGYDRDPGLVRAFMPPRLYRALAEVNSVNNSIFSQVTKNGADKLRIFYPANLKPTRNQIIDQSELTVIAGGVNYFPFLPINEDLDRLDEILSPFDEQLCHEVQPNFMTQCLSLIRNEDDDEWSNIQFIDFIKAYIANNPNERGILIIRRDRDIAKGTGTLLSPNDRSLGMQYTSQIVLTLYRIRGSKEKNWDGQSLWIPNMKFPDDLNFYAMRS